jgi:hypothetical protein
MSHENHRRLPVIEIVAVNKVAGQNYVSDIQGPNHLDYLELHPGIRHTDGLTLGSAAALHLHTQSPSLGRVL